MRACCVVQVVMAYAFATAVLLGVFWVSPNVAWIQWLIVAAVGFALYGPQMLIGLCGAEVVRKPAVSAAQGFLGWISYLGTLLSVPLGTVTKLSLLLNSGRDCPHATVFWNYTVHGLTQYQAYRMIWI